MMGKSFESRPWNSEGEFIGSYQNRWTSTHCATWIFGPWWVFPLLCYPLEHELLVKFEFYPGFCFSWVWYSFGNRTLAVQVTMPISVAISLLTEHSVLLTAVFDCHWWGWNPINACKWNGWMSRNKRAERVETVATNRLNDHLSLYSNNIIFLFFFPENGKRFPSLIPLYMCKLLNAHRKARKWHPLLSHRSTGSVHSLSNPSIYSLLPKNTTNGVFCSLSTFASQPAPSARGVGPRQGNR